jgi:2-oxoglutarate ferredoxin oxidoreductase subunit alpha
VVNSLYLQAADLERLIKERFARYQAIEEKETLAEEYLTQDAAYIAVAYGATARIAKAGVRAARAQGIPAGLIRPITLWPFPKRVLARAAQSAKAFVCVEMSMGQMVDDVRLAVSCSRPVAFFGHTGGIVPTPEEILAQLQKLAGGAH